MSGAWSGQGTGAGLPASLGVVLVTHQTRDEVLGALDALAADPHLPHDTEVVVVDAGSTDGSAGAARAHGLRPRVLALNNTGFGRAANAGIRATSASAVLVANADVRLGAGAAAALLTALDEEPALAAVGPQVRYPGGARQASARRQPTVGVLAGHALLGRMVPTNRWTRRYHAADLPGDAAREVDWLSGCALLLRRSAVEQVGGFDPGYFLYVEDLDLAVRLRAAGWRLAYEPAAVVEHRVGASTSRARLRALIHHARSLDRYLSRRLAGPARLLRPLLPVALAGWVLVTALLERRSGARSTTGERTDVEEIR